MTYLPTEPNTVLSIARATALAAGSGSPSAVGDRPAASGGAQGRRPCGSAGTVQAPPISECPSGCSRCGAPVADRVGLSVLEDGQGVADEYGFCSLACFVLCVRAMWIEAAA